MIPLERREMPGAGEPMIELLPLDQRRMPPTRPDEEARSHRTLCRCEVCLRPEGRRQKMLERRLQERKSRAPRTQPSAPGR